MENDIGFLRFFHHRNFQSSSKLSFFLAKKLAKQTVLVSGQQNFPEPAKGHATQIKKISLCCHLYEGCNDSISRAQFMWLTL
jgi:hypothetical protein